MTATATPATAAAIATALGRTPERRAHVSRDRPNLRYDVEQAGERRGAARALLRATARALGRRARSCTPARGARARRSPGRSRPRDPRRALPRWARARRADARPGRLRRRSHRRSSSPRRRSAWGSTRPNVRLVALVNLPDSLESYVQMVGRAGRDGEPSDTLLLAGRRRRHGAAPVRAGRRPDAATLLRRVYRALRATRAARATPEALAGRRRRRRTIRASSSGCSSRRASSRAASTRVARCGRARLPPTRTRRPRSTTLLDALRARGRGSRRADRSRSPRRTRVPPRQVAEHFGEDARRPVRRLRRLRPSRAAAAAALRITAVRSPTTRRGRSSSAVDGPHLAARPAQPRGDASRLASRRRPRPGAPRLRRARRRRRSGGDALGSRAGGGRRARRGRDRRRLPRAPRRARRRRRCRRFGRLDRSSTGARARRSIVERLRAWRSRRARRPTACPRTWCCTTRRCSELAAARPISRRPSWRR